MTFKLPIPGPNGEKIISIDPGSSVVFVGANGGGKTRLAAYIENALEEKAHRIAAHRALSLNPTVLKTSEKAALNSLRFGKHADGKVGNRKDARWNSQQAVSLLDDFGYLVQALFANQANISLSTHQRSRKGDTGPAEPTNFERLVAIWERLLPHRKLHISGDSIEVSISDSDDRYTASEMSDGERAIFYTIGQSLTAAKDTMLIFDEPELHVHPSIMAKLWDELEAERQDCAFVFITHDLTFAATRAAQKFVIHDYNPKPQWEIEEVPENAVFGEELTTLILGSRQPILFVEGNEQSLDIAIYRCCYPEWTVVPRGSCEEVIHSVVTMRRNQDLTRVTCSGIVDADDGQPDDVEYLKKRGVAMLPVSEIENIILLPNVSRAIAEAEGHTGTDLEDLLKKLCSDVFAALDGNGAIESTVVRYCKRRIDRLLKKFDLGNVSSIADLAKSYEDQTHALQIDDIASKARARINEAIANRDMSKLLANYDNKGLLAIAAKHLKGSKRGAFEAWLTRALRNETVPQVTAAIHDCLPEIQPQ